VDEDPVRCVRCGAETELRSADVPYCVKCVDLAYRESRRAGAKPPKDEPNEKS